MCSLVARLALLAVLGGAGCKINFDPSTFDTCKATRELGVPSFRWDGNDHCYSLHATPVGYGGADSACRSIGAHMVTLTSADENAAVVSGLSPDATTWIGMGNYGGGGLQWQTGEALLYSNWQVGQPIDMPTVVQDPDGSWRSSDQNQYEFICEHSVVVTSDRVYSLLWEQLTWDLARDSCDRVGAHLVTITSASELFDVEPLASGARWLGGYEPVPGTFEWITGEPFDYHVFDATQPDGVDENCLESRQPGDWNDDTCATAQAAICEYE